LISDAKAGVNSDSERSYSERAELPRSLKISERVARDIVSEIGGAGLKPGDGLPTEAQMVARYRVGRASVREALRILEVQGLVEIRPGPRGGPFLSSSSANSFGRIAALHFEFAGGTFGQLIDARQLIEPVVAAQAATQQDEGGLAGIAAALELEVHEDPTMAKAADFHRAVARASRNSVLALYSESLAEVVRERMMTRVLHPDDASHIHKDHLKIATAIRAGRATAAHRLMDEHLARYSKDYVESRLPGFLDQVINWV
jgi:GntR family transcriptional regulator, transcriptional repressor for pyruvate dehydrogenase complex